MEKDEEILKNAPDQEADCEQEDTAYDFSTENEYEENIGGDIEEENEPEETDEQVTYEIETENDEEDETDDFNDDDEFMETVTEPAMSPEKARQKEEELDKDIERAENRLAEIEPIYVLSESGGLFKLKEQLKQSLYKSVDDTEMKELKSSAKCMEDVIAVEKLISNFVSECRNLKRDIERYKEEKQKLRNIQLNMFKGAELPKQEDNTPVEDETTAEVISEDKKLEDSGFADGQSPESECEVDDNEVKSTTSARAKQIQDGGLSRHPQSADDEGIEE